MAVTKNLYPILEFDSEINGIITPNRHNRAKLPSICVVTFFGEVLIDFISKKETKIVNRYKSEMGEYPIYEVNYKGIQVCVIQAVVGSASIAMMTDYLIGYGVNRIITCGGCGVLSDIPEGEGIIPISALRDEGASYHYLAPSREILIEHKIIEEIKAVLTEHNVPYVLCKTWTTDALYRETPDMVTYRKEEGCQVVEMECATIASVAKFREIEFGQLLYSGDILADYNNYDDRSWNDNLTAREKLFLLSLEVAIR